MRSGKSFRDSRRERSKKKLRKKLRKKKAKPKPTFLITRRRMNLGTLQPE